MFFAETGKVPNIPGSYYSEAYGKYVVFEQVAEHNNFWECHAKATELLRQYGYKSEQ